MVTRMHLIAMLQFDMIRPSSELFTGETRMQSMKCRPRNTDAVFPAICAVCLLSAFIAAECAASGKAADEIVFETRVLCGTETGGAVQMLLRRGSCAAIFLMMENRGKTDFKGTAEILACDLDYVFVPLFRRPLDLACASRKVTCLYPAFPAWAHRVRIDVTPEGAADPVYTRQFESRWASGEDMVVLVVDEEGGSRTFLAGHRPFAGTFRLFESDGSLLPDSAEGYECVDAIMFGDFKADSLRKEKRAAILDWIRRGGTGLVHPAGGLGKLSSQVFRELLGRNAGPADSVADLSAGGKGPLDMPSGRAFLARIDAGGGDGGLRVVQEASGMPFLVRRSIGMGAVFFCAADLSLPMFAEWRGKRRFVDLCLDSPGAAMRRKAAAMVMDAVVEGDVRKTPAGVLVFAVCCSVVLAACVVPAVLRRGRHANLWLPVAVLCAGPGLAAMLDALILPAGVFATSASIIITESGGSCATGCERLCIGSSRSVEIDIGGSGEGLRLIGFGDREERGKGEIRAADGGTGAGAGMRTRLDAGIPLQLWRPVFEEGGILDADLELSYDENGLVARGVVENRTGDGISGACVVYGDFFGPIGDLPALSRKTVRASLRKPFRAGPPDFFAGALLKGKPGAEDYSFADSKLGVYKPWNDRIAEFSRFSGTGFSLDGQGGGLSAAVLLAGRIGRRGIGGGLSPEPETAGSWSLLLCSARAVFVSEAVLFPGVMTETSFKSAKGGDGAGEFEIEPGGARILKPCGVIQSVFFPLNPALFDRIDPVEQGIDSRGGQRISTSIFDFSRDEWILHSPGGRSRLPDGVMDTETGEVRFLFEGMEPGDLVRPLKVDFTAVRAGTGR